MLAAIGAGAIEGASAGPGPGQHSDGRGALAVTTGPPAIPDPIRLRLPDGAICSIAMEEYLKSVVPAEMPASWHLEALKAQAIAARTYAASYVATYGSICSTTACQAWDPTRRHARSDAAVDTTRGQLMLYRGGMIWSYYSSTCGGQTSTSPDDASAYCRAVRCSSDQTAQDLSSEAAAASFWGGAPTSYCSASSLYRWSSSVSRVEQEAILNRYLAENRLGTLRELTVTARNTSGKVTSLRVVGSGGTWTATSETTVRSILRSSLESSSRPAATLVVGFDGTTVTVRGGGFGHGIGLCQYGAKGLADAGRDYAAILRHYYSDIELQMVSLSSTPVPPAGARRLLMPLTHQRGSAACG